MSDLLEEFERDNPIEGPKKGWQPYLDPDERILWEGRPDGRFHISGSSLAETAFGLFFAGFSVFWMFIASQSGGVFWTFGLLFLFTGIGLTFNALFGNTLVRFYSNYTLTNKRAIIATQLPIRGRQFTSYPIKPDTIVDFDQGPLSSIYFHQRVRRVNDSDRVEKVGFERISDGEHVYKLMREIQRGAA